MVSCDFLNFKKPLPNGASISNAPIDLRKELHYRILFDLRDFSEDRVAARNAFYALTGLAILLGAIASFLIATDFQKEEKDVIGTIRPVKKMIVVGIQIGATMVTGSVASFKLTDMWHTRNDGFYQLRNLDSELVVGGCTTDTFSRIFKQVNLIEAEEYDLRGIFGPTASTSTDQLDELAGDEKSPQNTQDEAGADLDGF